MGSTACQPVPSGNLPDGTDAASMYVPRASLTTTPAPIPIGKLQIGAGKLPAPPIFQTRFALKLLLIPALVLSGCTTAHYRKSADREAAKVIAEKTPAVPNMDPRFTIEQSQTIALEGYPAVTNIEEAFGADKAMEVGARVLSLDDALKIGVEHSRSYQNQKEQVFLEALNLTLARYRFTPIFSAGANETFQTRVLAVEEEIERLTGTQLVRETQVVQQQQYSLSGRGNAGGDVLLRTGARIATDFTTDFLRFLTGDPRWVMSSRLGATITQPLLRGAGFKVTMENLTQAERNLLYALRDFVQYRREFAVDIASRYYQVLQNKDEARNAWLGYQNFKQNVERERAFAAEGQRTQTALGQLQQAELSTETQWINAVRNYRQSLDQFKIVLGLPTDARVVLDDQALNRLQILHPNISVAEAVKIALETRLDLQNARGRFEDAARKTGVAANAFLPDLNLILRGDVDTKPGNHPLALDFETARWTVSADVSLPLNRKAERNAYRASLIAYERAGRNLQLAVDEIKLDIHEAWRALDQAKRNFENSEIGVKLSERRVEEQELLTELGRGIARDLVDARKDLISARNQRTSALIRHTLARLQFWRDMGILFIREDGKWDEVKQAQRGEAANEKMPSR
ncbi:MAG: TolC family protein [Verrucomicrobia bacterium]|nr:TolC family protein [Verrucomicrobiota bacterium]